MPRRASDPPSTTKRGVRRTRPSVHERHEHSPQSDATLLPHRTVLTPQEHYRAEKARRVRDARQELIDEARREYLALLAAEAGGPKGGRPRKVGRPKKVVTANVESEWEPEADAEGDAEFGEGVTEFESGDTHEDDEGPSMRETL